MRQRLAATRCAALLVGACLIIAVPACARPAPEPGAPLATFVSYLDESLPGWMEQHGVPGAAVALVHGGELVWSSAYGYADVEELREMTVDSVFRVESISKSVTAWGVMRLLESGVIGLHDPVQGHLGTWELPVPATHRDGVTVARLLSNSAGMPLGPIGEEYAPGAEMPSLREFLSREVRLASEPGSRFAYSNVGYALLELMVEEASGTDFAAYMRDEVMRPLGMHGSTFAWDDGLASLVPTGYDLRGKPVPTYLYPVLASGGLYATVGDVARFVAAEVGGSAGARLVLAADTVRDIHTPRVGITGLFRVVADGYGAGHFTERLEDGRLAVWHGGQGHGWMSHFHAVPDAGVGIVILTNSQRSWPLMALVLDRWAHWNALGRLGMSTITVATTALIAVVGVVMLAAVWLLLRLELGLLRGERRWRPLSSAHRRARLLRLGAGAATLALLAWAAAQPYLFVSSVFPGLAGVAGASLAALALVVIVSALVPSVRER